jgi:adenylylsulfate kinase
MNSLDGRLGAGTIYITGISASGKSTLARRLLDDLGRRGIGNVRLLDGEEIRHRLLELGRNYGYSNEDRNAVALETASMALEHNQQGYITIVATIAHVRSTRDRVRERIPNFMEVYLVCPVEVCAKRDRKGHYAKANAGLLDNFVGVTEPYQRSEQVELTLDTYRKNVEECSSILLRETLSFLGGGKRDRLLETGILPGESGTLGAD